MTKKPTWRCGWCSAGRHARCRGAAHNQGAILRCSCQCRQHESCLSCGSTENVLNWECADRAACRDTLAARSAANPLREELDAVRLMGGEARRRVLMERTRRQVMEAVQECGIDQMLADAEASAPRRSRRTESREPGACLCCGERTKGGRFLPGHDMKLKGQLRRAAQGGDFEAVRQLREFGWPVPEGAPSAPVLALAG